MGSTGNRIKGKLKEVEGRATGDKVREAEGRIQSTAGKVASKVKSSVRRAKMRVRGKAATTKTGRKAAAAKYTP